MEIRKITKTDKGGKRLFIEIGKAMKKNDVLPALKKGDEVLLMPRRKLTETEMENLVGKYVKYFDIGETDPLYFEGIIKKNKKEFWETDEDEKVKKSKYALIDSAPKFRPTDFFDNLNDVSDLQVIPDIERHVNKVNCNRLSCKKSFFEAYKHCPHCGKKNTMFKREVKNGKRGKKD